MRYAACLLTVNLLSLVAVAQGAQTCDGTISPTTPNSEFNARSKDGTVIDYITGLVWKMCAEGQSYNADSNTCSGTAATYTWQQALQRAQAVDQGTAGEALNRSDWRVPDVKELSALVERACADPAINTSAFHVTPSGPFWSSSPSARTAGQAWTVDFSVGGTATDDMTHVHYLRLVRDGL